MQFEIDRSEQDKINELIKQLTVPRVDETFLRINNIMKLHWIGRLERLESDTDVYLKKAATSLSVNTSVETWISVVVLSVVSGMTFKAHMPWHGLIALCGIPFAFWMNWMNQTKHVRFFKTKLRNTRKRKSPEVKAKQLADLLYMLRHVLAPRTNEQLRYELDKLCSTASELTSHMKP